MVFTHLHMLQAVCPSSPYSTGIQHDAQPALRFWLAGSNVTPLGCSKSRVGVAASISVLCRWTGTRTWCAAACGEWRHVLASPVWTCACPSSSSWQGTVLTGTMAAKYAAVQAERAEAEGIEVTSR